MRLELDTINAHAVFENEDEREWLSDYLSFEDSSSKFTRRRDGSLKVGKPKRVSLLRFDGSFPAGLLRRVKKAALEKRINIKIIDRRKPPCTVLTWKEATGTDDPWVYDFQREGVEQALKRTRGILDMPTGSGKTETAVALAMRLGMTNTLFIAPEADLMHNAAKRWELRTSVQAGRIGDGHMQPVDGFTSATFQTLASRITKKDPKLLKYLATVGALIIDEVHTLPASSFYNVAQSIPAYYRIGMSGTPLARGDRRSLFAVAATGSIIHKVETQLLIDRGFISRPHIRMVRCEQEGDEGTWQKAYAANIVSSNGKRT